jgi:aminopeptidase
VGCPVPGWAQRVYGDPDLGPLWADLRFALRLDEDDPAAAWQARLDELTAQAARLNEAAFTAVRFRGEGTDLLVTLHPDSLWEAARYVTPWGIPFVPNLPTEEIFTTPDFRGVEGTVATTKPVLINGVRVEGLVLRFEAGRIVDVAARTGAGAVRAQIAVDDGARRLGEVSLVDASSRIGRSHRIFKDTLLDENAACHIAWGVSCYETLGEHLPATNEERIARGVNMSRIHQDVMIGGPGVAVFGVTKEGSEVPVLLRERWQL